MRTADVEYIPAIRQMLLICIFAGQAGSLQEQIPVLPDVDA